MALTPEDWHQRFTQQAAWTAELRRHLFEQVRLNEAQRVIEIGCGTGAILGKLDPLSLDAVFGLDLDGERLNLARTATPHAHLSQADGRQLPFAESVFDVVLCHFFLLWVQNPDTAVAEMVRVTRPGGAVLALAEPDYGGRIDYPEPLQGLGLAQTVALRRQGAEPEIGRQLGPLLSQAGLRDVQVGVLGGRWGQPPGPKELALEWAVLEADLEGSIPPDEFNELRRLDEAAWQQRERILYVPTFYAWGYRIDA